MWKFNEFELDTRSGKLFRDNSELVLRPQSLQVLTVLLEHAGQVVSKDHFFAEVWPESTVTDDSLTQCITDIRKVLDDKDRKLVRTAPRRGYALTCPVYWQNGKTRTFPNLAIAGLATTVTLILVFLSSWSLWRDEDQTKKVAAIYAPENWHYSSEPSIAVLPFTDLSDDQQLKFFGEAIADELITHLSRNIHMRVIARYSAFEASQTTSDRATLGQLIDVNTFIEGSVRRSAEHVRVHTRLVAAQSGKTLWNEQFSIPFDQHLVVPDLLVQGVAKALATETTKSKGIEGHTTDPITLNLFAHARHLIHQNEPALFQQAIELLKQALERDPRYTRARAELARVLARYDNKNRVPHQVHTEASKISDQLFQLAPYDPIANAWYGWNKTVRERQYKQGAQFWRQALVSDPYNSDVTRGAIHVLIVMGKLEAAKAIAEFTISIDPLCLMCQRNYIGALFSLNELDLALAHTTHLRRTYPRHSPFYELHILLLLSTNRIKEAQALVAKAESEWVVSDVVHAVAAHRAGDEQKFNELVNKAAQYYGGDAIVAMAYAATGQPMAAIPYLESSFYSTRLLEQEFRYSIFSEIWDSPEGRKLLVDHGLSEAQLPEWGFADQLF